MATITIQSILQLGYGGERIEAQCHITNGLPAVVIVGLGGKAIDEAKERLRGAFACSGLQLPKKRITLNLAPADLHKESTSLDLAMAVAILAASGQTTRLLGPTDAFIGELDLYGTVRPVRGIIGALVAGTRLGIKTFFIPEANYAQASLVPGIEVIPISNLASAAALLKGAVSSIGLPAVSARSTPTPKDLGLVLDDIVGQEHAKRAITIAAAGGHNILLYGPPGTGKSMLAKALRGLLPPLTDTEALEVTHLHSLAEPSYDRLITFRPFRAPHHTASDAAIIGGGQLVKPGEISLSNRGVLLLDEMPEFKKSTLEALRQPLEERQVTITRMKHSVTYPAHFLLVATANPCPCGYFGSDKDCICTPLQVMRYQQRISGPILDRIDLFVEVQTVDYGRLLGPKLKSMHHETPKEAVVSARRLQAKRFNSQEYLNCDMTNDEIRNKAHFKPEAAAILTRAAEQLGLSARSYMRVIKVARTIADLGDSDHISTIHLSEALQYRSRLKQNIP